MEGRDGQVEGARVWGWARPTAKGAGSEELGLIVWLLVAASATRFQFESMRALHLALQHLAHASFLLRQRSTSTL